MKSIAFVFDGLGFGGIERIGVDYVRMCREIGYEVDVYNLNPSENAFASNFPVGTNYYSYKMSRKACPETYSYGIQKWWWGKYAYATISPLLTVSQIIRKKVYNGKNYDVAIAISGHINDLSFVAKGFIKANKKMCWCHGTIISYLAICDAYAILYKNVDDIITLSSAAEKDIYAGRKYLYDKHITKLYNPTFIRSKLINEDKVKSLKEEYGDYVLKIARFETRKGHEIAIKAMKQLKEMGIDKKILFAGDGDRMGEIKSISCNEGMDDNCVFLGNCHDIENYIAGCYINLLTSRWEGLPTVIVEAMSLGKPCIMTNTDDGEVSHNGEYCLLEEIDDVEGIANALKTLYTDSGMYQKYTELAIKRAESFQPEIIKEQFRKLIESY